MKVLLALATLFFVQQINAAECPFGKTDLGSLDDSVYELQFAVQVPLPPKFFELLEKYFGELSKKDCQNSIEVTKIKNRKTQVSYLAFYTNQDRCDGGNSFGFIFKESQPDRVVATIEDSYIDCK